MEPFLQIKNLITMESFSQTKNFNNCSPFLQIKNLKKHFTTAKKTIVKAVDDISFSLFKGESLGIIGESGSGKSTLGKLILRLLEPTNGVIDFKNQNICHFDKKELKNFRKKAQMIFQNPNTSLNPMMTILEILKEPFLIHNIDHSEKDILQLLDYVGLPKTALEKFPHEFSGGQMQRIAIARAISLKPELIICDEPTSALDLSIQAQILNLLKSLREIFSLTYIFISHDLAVVKYISSKVAVLYFGNLVEMAPVEEFYKNPLHPYTKDLLFSKNIIEKNGSKDGCGFSSRCKKSKESCFLKKPNFYDVGKDHFVKCWGHFKE